jgi:hypothetical protein
VLRAHRLNVELLEDRVTPATSGITWPDGDHLTLSFVPDGTPVSNYKSNLFQALGGAGPTAAWQQTILRAFQTWLSATNVNVGVVPDGGQPLGASGAVEGDSRFGDIRIAAAPIGGNTLITNTQFQWSGTTWSGDIVVNSAFKFSLTGGTNDLYTCMLNEVGNVLGVLDSHTDTTSGVYYQYIGAKTGINAHDLADVQSLYGVRSPDQYRAAGNNSTRATATNLGIALTGENLQADITTPNSEEWFKLTIPVLGLPLLSPQVIGLNVHLGTSGLSCLVGKLQVYDGTGNLLGTATATDPLNGDLTLQVSGGLLNQLLGGLSYYIRVSGDSSTFGVGSYNLTASLKLSDGSIIAAPILNSLLSVVGHTLTTATQLPSLLLGGQKPDARFDYTAKANLGSGTETDYFKVTSPSAAGQKMNVLVWPLASSGLLPRVDVYDGGGNPIPATLLANENGYFSIEVDNVAASRAYYVKVSAQNPGGGHDTGSYFFGVDFNTEPATKLTNFDSGTLSPTTPTTAWTLSVSRNQLYQFELSASASAAAQVQMDVYDSAGNEVFTLRATSTLPAVTGHVYLSTGNYTVRFTAVPQGNGVIPNVAFDLTGLIISDPIGPQPDTGITSPTPAPGTATSPQGSGTGQPYYA